MAVNSQGVAVVAGLAMASRAWLAVCGLVLAFVKLHWQQP